MDSRYFSTCIISRLQICPLYSFGKNPPQMVPRDLNIGVSPGFGFDDSGPNIYNPAYLFIIPWKSKDYFLNGFSVKTIVLVGIYNQQFKGTILFMVFDFQGIPCNLQCSAFDSTS